MEELLKIFPLHLRSFCTACFEKGERPEEIRLRIHQPLMVDTGEKELFWDEGQGAFAENPQGCYLCQVSDLQEMLSYISNYSLYAFDEEIRGGFLTLKGGHRIGIAGKVVCENGHLRTIRQITFLNIRIATEHKGCADEILPYIRKWDTIYNTLILSPPGMGKTTLLRDCIRQLSWGTDGRKGKKIGVVDERSELAACHLGIPQNDLGYRTDVLDTCPKSEGMLLLLRSMSPEIIGVDELGGQADYEAVEAALHCGCRILGTKHGESIEELKEKPYLAKWLENGFFERYIFLSKSDGKKREYRIYDENLKQIY